MSKAKIIIFFFSFSLLTSICFQNCNALLGQGGTSTGNPSLHLSFAAYGAAGTGAQLQKTVVTVGDSLQNVTVIFCISKIKFKTIDHDDDQDEGQDVQFIARQVALSPLGTDLDFISLPPEEYRQVEMDLNNAKCSSGASVTVSNSHGDFSTNEGIKMKFNGVKHVDFSTQEIALKIQAIVEELSTVTGGDQIKDKIQSVFGELD
ncbi:MAG: hypothetical protein A4S09_04390 [Proteobacteria bacterium SG_bin7]|nr:MAG: hypothetical protein A4S09_04390 [Proteobacteria bacterium SG_bin7]